MMEGWYTVFTPNSSLYMYYVIMDIFLFFFSSALFAHHPFSTSSLLQWLHGNNRRKAQYWVRGRGYRITCVTETWQKAGTELWLQQEETCPLKHRDLNTVVHNFPYGTMVSILFVALCISPIRTVYCTF